MKDWEVFSAAFGFFTVLPCCIWIKQHCTGLWRRWDLSSHCFRATSTLKQHWPVTLLQGGLRPLCNRFPCSLMFVAIKPFKWVEKFALYLFEPGLAVYKARTLPSVLLLAWKNLFFLHLLVHWFTYSVNEPWTWDCLRHLGSIREEIKKIITFI